jgi:hypothetical protein
MLHELLKVNLQLPQPVDLLELPIIANYPTWDAEQPEHYLQVIQRLQEAEQQLLNPAPVEEEPRMDVSDIDQALASSTETADDSNHPTSLLARGQRPDGSP